MQNLFKECKERNYNYEAMETLFYIAVSQTLLLYFISSETNLMIDKIYFFEVIIYACIFLYLFFFYIVNT